MKITKVLIKTNQNGWDCYSDVKACIISSKTVLDKLHYKYILYKYRNIDRIENADYEFQFQVEKTSLIISAAALCHEVWTYVTQPTRLLLLFDLTSSCLLHGVPHFCKYSHKIVIILSKNITAHVFRQHFNV